MKKYAEITTGEKEILVLFKNLITEYYDKAESDCRKFKHICHKHLPQIDTKENGNGYTKNKNVFDIESKTILDIRESKETAEKFIQKLINSKSLKIQTY